MEKVSFDYEDEGSMASWRKLLELYNSQGSSDGLQITPEKELKIISALDMPDDCHSCEVMNFPFRYHHESGFAKYKCKNCNAGYGCWWGGFTYGS